jgi:superfamily II DNA or RNA helicase
MAKTLTPEELRNKLTNPDGLDEDLFLILRSIGGLLSSDDSAAVGREMLLRALEKRDSFGQAQEILDSLARQAGYFPYADADSLCLSERIAYEFHRPLEMPEEFVFHREQAEIYHRLLMGENVILSAPTSFGKSRIIDAIIATGNHKNIAVIVPTLALIDETRRRLAAFAHLYKIISHVTKNTL